MNNYVKVPENHIVIDFDIKDENGNKSAELSKSGSGIHLHYIYTKRYRVWLMQGYTVDVSAKTISIISVDDKPLKIKFLDDKEYLLAEFYTDKIHGWAEINCLVDGTL